MNREELQDGLIMKTRMMGIYACNPIENEIYERFTSDMVWYLIYNDFSNAPWGEIKTWGGLIRNKTEEYAL